VDYADNHRTNCATNLEAVRYPIESRGRRRDKLYYQSHPKEGNAFVSSVTIAKSAEGAVAIECPHKVTCQYEGIVLVVVREQSRASENNIALRAIVSDFSDERFH
jgi:hypothetical protein